MAGGDYEPAPSPALTLVVSLEAIFLSAFVMIGQNPQAEFQRAKAEGVLGLRHRLEPANAVIRSASRSWASAARRARCSSTTG